MVRQKGFINLFFFFSPVLGDKTGDKRSCPDKRSYVSGSTPVLFAVPLRPGWERQAGRQAALLGELHWDLCPQEPDPGYYGWPSREFTMFFSSHKGHSYPTRPTQKACHRNSQAWAQQEMCSLSLRTPPSSNIGLDN